MISPRHSVYFSNVFWQYVIQLAKYVFPFLLYPYLTRILGPQHFAVYAYVMALMGLLRCIVEFGFSLYGIRFFGTCKNNKREQEAFIGRSVYAKLLISVTIAFFLWILSHFIPILTENLEFCFLCFVDIVIVTIIPDFVFQSYEFTKPLTTRFLVIKCISLVCIFVLVKGANDLIAVALINIASSMAALIWTLYSMYMNFGIKVDYKALPGTLQMIKESALYGVSNISYALTNSLATIIIGVIFTEKSTISFWSLAISIISAVQSLYSPVISSMYPHIVNGRDFRFAFRVGIIILPISIFGTALFLLFSDYIVFILGGSGFEDTSRLLIYLSPILPISFYGMYIGWPILGSLGCVKELTMVAVGTGAFNILALCCLLFLANPSIVHVCVIRCFVEGVGLVLRSVLLLMRLPKRRI